MIPEAEPTRRAMPNEGPLVYGYLLAETPDEIQIGLWRKEIGYFCREHGYRLALVFVDRGVPHDHVTRPGFTGLLDVLALEGAHGVVVPNIEHLSTDSDVAAVLRRLVRHTASQLIVIDDVEERGDAR